ncbi:SDR family NAD(P)-dependent oxidoreductase [Crocinitomix catalasitica]|uniref:SDR family NAD(P)-dependent oxidoreductase n=1 Tax=Crocinitomix catalasitica TaxID=184607 RepID=UPI0004863466|nr:SDR family oxidoreductase [Crocinitomix catalasitica]
MNTDKNKTILIIGSAGGLGTELIQYFEDKLYQLALHFHDQSPTYTDNNIKTYQADITIESEVSEMIKAIYKDFGKIDVVIHNAGVSRNNMSWKTDKADWDETIAVNLTGPFLVSKYVTPYMRDANFGRIIFMSSVVAQTGFIGTAAYGASKAGLIGLTKTLAKELANKNITVNSIALGYFNAGMINDVPLDMQEQLKTQIPVGKLGNPQDLAALIAFIISDESNYLTGQVLNLNGGLYA